MVGVTVTDMVGLNERGFYSGILDLTNAIATIAGPILGGGIVQWASWKWCVQNSLSILTLRIFYLNFVPLVVIIVGVQFFLTLKIDATPTKEKFKRIDVLGLMVFVTSFTALLFSVTSGGVLFPWKSACVIIPMVIGIIGAIAFLLIEKYVAPDPMFPLRVFKNRTAIAAYIGDWVHSFIVFGIIYYAFLWVLLLCRPN
jgi:MFS family permease